MKLVPSFRSSQAFSLLELLVVMAIVGALSAVAVGTFNQTLRGTRITSTAQAVSDAMSLARNTALARNVPVQLRFYKLPDIDLPNGAPTIYRGMQIFVCESRATNALTKPILFPQQIVISANAKKSSILQLTETTPGGSDPAKLSGMTYTYIFMTFGANGIVQPASNALLTSTNEWYVTLQAQRDLATDSSWPINYATVKINPVTGSTQIFQPR